MKRAPLLCRSLVLQLILAASALAIAGVMPAAAQQPGYSPGSPAADQYTEQIPAGRGVGSRDRPGGKRAGGPGGETPVVRFGTGIEPAAAADSDRSAGTAPTRSGAAGGDDRERRPRSAAVGRGGDRIPPDVAASAAQQADGSSSLPWLLTLLFAAACAAAAAFAARARVRRAAG